MHNWVWTVPSNLLALIMTSSWNPPSRVSPSRPGLPSPDEVNWVLNTVHQALQEPPVCFYWLDMNVFFTSDSICMILAKPRCLTTQVTYSFNIYNTYHMPGLGLNQGLLLSVFHSHGLCPFLHFYQQILIICNKWFDDGIFIQVEKALGSYALIILSSSFLELSCPSQIESFLHPCPHVGDGVGVCVCVEGVYPSRYVGEGWGWGWEWGRGGVCVFQWV